MSEVIRKVELVKIQDDLRLFYLLEMSVGSNGAKVDFKSGVDGVIKDVGTKTPSAIASNAAVKLFDALIKMKLASGWVVFDKGLLFDK